MKAQSGKFLVALSENRVLFFGFWALVVGAFIMPMVACYKKYTRSNFKERKDTFPVGRHNTRHLGENAHKKPEPPSQANNR